MPESRGIMRKPEGKIGASSEKDASIGANMSSAQVPTERSSTPLQSWDQSNQDCKYIIGIGKKLLILPIQLKFKLICPLM